MKKIKIKISILYPSFLLTFFLTSATALAVDSRGFLSFGLFNFNQSQFHQVYGNLPVFGLSLEVFPWKNFGLASGLAYLSRTGEATVISGIPEKFSVSFNRLTIPGLFKFRLSRNRFQASVGLGLAYSGYQEDWKNIGLSYRGHSVHFRYELAADYNLTGKIFLRVSLVGESIPTEVRSPLLNGAQANLAGLSFLAGIGYKIGL